ncbi:MAG TPA: carboxypeptidase regulatory-like domain-containing protein [Vicinamibacterales bacterium]|nr:carboxypeptidase regulatory-like domain-containing protein [Vicinamibacterales bacterium]
MLRCVRASGILLSLLLLPSALYAQAAITGVVRDSSGAVLPGVTVEAASPVLIEKVRSVVTDDTGQYRVVDLRPGTYSVTFSLPGFSTVRREGIELTGTFVASVNADLKVGALEETITVTGETPVVDVQSARTQTTIGRDIMAAIPSSRNVNGVQALIPGMQTNTDSGGISGTLQGGASTIHGGRGSDSRIYADGNNMGWAGGSGGGGNMPQVASSQEVVMTLSGGLGEAETSGVVVNVIPREGSNTFSGGFNYSGSSDALQGSNYTDDLKAQGLRAPSELLNVYNVSPLGGGRIIRDKLWFYATYQQSGAENSVPGMWWNRNAGNPNAWGVDFDKSEQAKTKTVQRQGTVRLTWQATPRNKFNIHWSEQYNDDNYGRTGGTATQTPEASTRTYYIPSRQPHASWSSPITGKLLAEAGWGMYQARYRFAPRNDGTAIKGMVRVVDQGTIDGIANLAYRFPTAPGQGGFTMSLIGTLANTRASVAYVTGAHNMKFGYQGGFNNPSQTYDYYDRLIAMRFRDGVPNQLTQTIVTENNIKYTRNLLPLNLYAQDQWTAGRLTLQGGVRYDHLASNYPDQGVGGPKYPFAPTEIFFAKGSTPGYDWSDITPRVGLAYDVFGNGKTAFKFNIGKYLEAITATNSDWDLNPLIRTTIQTTRGWTDSSKDYVVNCDLSDPAKNGECDAMDSKTLGQPVFNRTFDENWIHGWGVRPYNWSMGVQVQQELMPRVSLNVGYFRNWWGNWYVVDNRLTTTADYTPFSITAPLDSRLPNGGGYAVSGLYNPIPQAVGLVDELAQSPDAFGSLTENWQGVDVGVTARLRNGLTVQGGTSTGRKLADGCDVRANLPEYGRAANGITTNSSVTANVTALGGGSTALGVMNPYCRIEEPYRTDFRGLATYTIPKVDVQFSGTWISAPGDSLAANYVVTNAVANAGPVPLGRNLTSGANTVSLIAPHTLYADRRNNIDFRIAKILRYGRTRSQIGLDVFNVTNTDVATGLNEQFIPGGAWLTPTTIQPARFARISASIDF